jgi:hypothetical protein
MTPKATLNVEGEDARIDSRFAYSWSQPLVILVADDAFTE